MKYFPLQHIFLLWPRVAVFLAVLLLFAPKAMAKEPLYVFDYTSNCSCAYQYAMAMHFAEARVALDKELKTNAGNLMAVYLADYEDCISLLITGDKTEYGRRSGNMDTRLDLIDKGSDASPWCRFCKAGVYMHWAIINFQFGDRLKATYRFRKAYSLLNENARLYPAFEYNKVFTGLTGAVVGSLPGNYQWLASVLGISGNLEAGVAQLGNFVNTHTAADPLYAETVLYYSFVRFYLANQQQEVWDYLASPRFPVSGNLLNTYTKVLLAIDYHKSAEALAALKSASADTAFSKYAVFDYQMGIVLLHNEDPACIGSFQQYLKKCKSDNLIKDSWQKMALYWYMAGNMQQAAYCRKQAGAQGGTRLDADKQAQQFADGDTWPVKPLLQARLLSDGGYYARAMTVLAGINTAILTGPADKLEYYYRYGKVYQETGGNSKALEYYGKAIAEGKGRQEQFAARAALQTGLIYERNGLATQAIAMYRQCLDMPAHDFQNSIDQQAKAGINRLQK